MKKLLLATTCAIGVSVVPAFSADLPVRIPVKAPVAAPIPHFSWTGCYVGAHVGGGWGQKDFADDFFTPASGLTNASSPQANTSGWLGGGQVGCDYQFATNWVVGVEGAGSWADIKGSSDPFFSGKAVFNAQTKWIATATAASATRQTVG